MLKWKVCIAVAGRSLQAGRSLTIPWEMPRVDARASPQGGPQGGRSRLRPLNPQKPPNHLSHIPNGFESNGFALVSFDFVCRLWRCVSTPLGRAVLWEVRCMPRRLCVGAQGFVAFGNVQRWGGEFPLEVPPGVPQSFDQRFPQRTPPEVPSEPPRGSPSGFPGVLPGFPSGFLTLGGVCSRRPQFYICCCDACFCQGPGCEFRC
jgi:hypothetical protein